MTSRILTCPLPSNINTLTANGFMFSIERIPELTYFCQSVDLPEISLGQAVQGTPFVDVPLPGEKLDFGSLRVEFMVDSHMKNYRALFRWMQGLGHPEDFDQYEQEILRDTVKTKAQGALSDATLIVLGSNNLPVQIIQFVDCYPTNLSSMNFLSTAQDVQYIGGTVTMAYSYYKFVD